MIINTIINTCYTYITKLETTSYPPPKLSLASGVPADPVSSPLLFLPPKIILGYASLPNHLIDYSVYGGLEPFGLAIE